MPRNARRAKKKEVMKRQANKEDDSQASLSRAQKDKNGSGKKKKVQYQATNAGKQRFCELCKAAGTSEFVCVT